MTDRQQAVDICYSLLCDMIAHDYKFDCGGVAEEIRAVALKVKAMGRPESPTFSTKHYDEVKRQQSKPKAKPKPAPRITMSLTNRSGPGKVTGRPPEMPSAVNPSEKPPWID